MEDEVLEERFRFAQRAGPPVRTGLVALVAAAYFLHPPPGSVAWLAEACLVLGLSYALVVQFVRPYERFGGALSARATTALDGGFIVLFVVATGGYDSPFYLLWFSGLVAVAFRYGMRPTIAAGVVYAAVYVAIAAAFGQLLANLPGMLLRGGLLVLVAVHAGLLAEQTLAQTRARVRHLDQLRSAHEELQGLDRLKTQFLNTAAHELRTPLTPIAIQLQLLKEGNSLDKRQERAVEILDRNIERVRRLVDDVLDAARLQSGAMRVVPREVDLNDLASDAVALYREPARRKGIHLRLQLAGGRVTAHADPARVTQVMVNLLANALKFTPGGGEVVVATRSADGRALVEVRDTGAGLSAAQLSQLFKPFSQVHEGELQREGAGLGLFIARGIVEQQGGTLTAASDGPGRGAVFTVALPPAT